MTFKTFDTRPRFSHDGTQIAFLRGTSSIRNLFTMSISDPESIVQRTFGFNTKMGLDWTSDSQFLIYDSNQRGDRNIWQLSIDDNSVINLGAKDGQYPTLDQQNSKLVYMEVRYQANLNAFSLADGRETQLTQSPKYDNFPAFSPDGEHLAYISNRLGFGSLWIQALSTGVEQQKLALPERSLLLPDWSTDGASLLVSAIGDQGYQCFEYQVSNTNFRRVEADEQAISNCIYASQNRVFAIDKRPHTIGQLLAINERDEVQVLSTLPMSSIRMHTDSQVLFTQIDKPGIYILNLDTGKHRALLEDFPANFAGYWTLQNDDIYYYRHQGDGELWQYNISSGEASRKLPSVSVAVGNILAVSPDQQQVVISERGTNQGNIFLGQIPTN